MGPVKAKAECQKHVCSSEAKKKRGKSIVRSIEVETTVKLHQLIVKAGLELVMG